jgi:hypothetical protein
MGAVFIAQDIYSLHRKAFRYGQIDYQLPETCGAGV